MFTSHSLKCISLLTNDIPLLLFHVFVGRDNVSNVIAFSQYAQYCCNTSGSSINAIAKYFQNKQRSPSFHLSFIDRWSTNSGLISTFTQLIEAEVRKFPPERQQSVLLLFTAHSLPLRVSN